MLSKISERPRKNLHKLAILAILTAFTLSLHLTFLPVPHFFHLIHRRLCYFPIVLGSLWFGLRGGMVVATIISAVTFPLALNYENIFINPEMTEIIFYIAIGLFSGALVEGIKKEKKKSEDLTQKLLDNERLAALGQMSASVAHEIRTPMSSIKGCQEILARDFEQGHPHREFIDIIDEELKRLEGVVNDFLDLGKPLSLKPFALIEARSAARNAVTTLTPFAESHGVLIELLPSEEKLFFMGDADRIHQAVTNLLRNAVQSSPRGERVTLSVSLDSGDVRIAVSDRGKGFGDADTGLLFEPFYTKREGGTGLGLAIARMIVSGHGGRVSASAAGDGGAVFSIYLPLSKREAAG